MRTKRGDKRRARNFLEPNEDQCDESTDRLISAMRIEAQRTHRDSFVSSRERDLIAVTLGRRAVDRLGDLLGEQRRETNDDA